MMTKTTVPVLLICLLLAPGLSAAGFPVPPLLRLDVPAFDDVPLLASQGSSGDDSSAPRWFEKIKLSGLLAGEARWKRTEGSDVSLTATSSDLYLRLYELGVEADLADWASATMVLNSEWIGDSLNQGDGTVVVDEAHLDIVIPHLPLYLVLGKRTQPFGLFENPLLTDPLVQDAFETKVVGMSMGIRTAWSTDVSATLYKGRVLSDHLSQSRLYDATAAPAPEVSVSQVDSWILSGTSTPVKDIWSVFAAFSSEPGAGRRMTTFNLGSNFIVPGLKNLQLDAEYVRALHREDLPGTGQSFREAALSVAASYQFVLRPRLLKGGRNYLARKSHRLAHPMEVSARFEAFDDGSRAAALQSWSVKNRVSLGGRYTFFDQGNVLVAVDVEFRRQTLRISPAFEGTVGSANEIYVRLGLDF